MKNFQILLSSLFTGLTTIFICPSLYANCTNASVNANFNAAIPKVTVSPEMPLGTVLAVSRPLTPGNAPVECKNVTSVVFTPYFTGTSAKKSTYGENVYNTGISGIGVRGVTEGLANDIVYYGAQKTYTYSTPATFPVNNRDTYFEFIKIGPISLIPYPVTAAQMRSDVDSAILATGYININAVVSATCYAKQPSVQVPLGTFTNFDFTGPGSSTRTVPFNFSFTCNKGTKVKAILNGTKVTGYTDVIALSTAHMTENESTASGVGVQVLDSKGTPITVGTSMDLFDSANVGDTTVTWGARYFQTGTTITGGIANATASVELTYE